MKSPTYYKWQTDDMPDSAYMIISDWDNYCWYIKDSTCAAFFVPGMNDLILGLFDLPECTYNEFYGLKD